MTRDSPGIMSLSSVASTDRLPEDGIPPAKAMISRWSDERTGEEKTLRASACESRAARTAPATSSRRRTSKTCSFRFNDSAALSVIVTLSYGPNLAAMWRQSAIIVAKLLKGIKPSDLPVEQPTKFELVLNLRTAKSLDLTMPTSVLLRADEVIE